MSLLPERFRIRDDLPLQLERVDPPVADPVRYAPICDWSHSRASDNPPKLVRLHLSDEWEAEADDFRRVHGDRGCACFLSPPCNHCTHPGNPLNLDETPEAWVMGYESAATPAGPRCPHCDDTGDVHGLDGEWRGRCACRAGQVGAP